MRSLTNFDFDSAEAESINVGGGLFRFSAFWTATGNEKKIVNKLGDNGKVFAVKVSQFKYINRVTLIAAGHAGANSTQLEISAHFMLEKAKKCVDLGLQESGLRTLH